MTSDKLAAGLAGTTGAGSMGVLARASPNSFRYHNNHTFAPPTGASRDRMFDPCLLPMPAGAPMTASTKGRRPDQPVFGTVDSPQMQWIVRPVGRPNRRQMPITKKPDRYQPGTGTNTARALPPGEA